jgi:hypothetical protein
MICYTLSDCVLKNLNADTQKKKIITDLLGVFPQENNPHKVVIDRTGKIIDIYNTYIDTEAGVFYWLQIMGDNPSSWEPIDVDNIEQATTNEDIFLMICSQTEDKMLIVYHHNGWTKGRYYHKRNILHNDTPIRILDRNEAIKLLSLSEEKASEEISLYKKDLQQPIIQTTNITDSIVAQNGSTINRAKIEK